MQKKKIILPYIPKEHKKYGLLPHSHKDGGEVFDYPVCMLNELEEKNLLQLLQVRLCPLSFLTLCLNQ